MAAPMANGVATKAESKVTPEDLIVTEYVPEEPAEAPAEEAPAQAEAPAEEAAPAGSSAEE